MAEKSFLDNRYDSLQMLRGIAGILVVLEHVRFLNCGSFAVDIFFCLSGFMILFSTQKDSSCFLQKRLIRILPLYYLMTVGTYLSLLFLPNLFEKTQANPLYLIKSLLFIPFDMGDGVLQPLVRIGWTINCEMFFYLIFFIAMKISHKHRAIISSGLLLSIILIAQLTGLSWAPLAFYGDWVMLEFILGMACYYIAAKLHALYRARRLPGFCGIGALFIACLLLLVLMATKHSINVLSFRRPLIWGLCALIIVLCFFVMGLFLPTPKALTQLGNISFSLYLLHYYPVMYLDRKIFDFSVPSPKAFLGVALCLFISTTLAYISWALIERRLGNKLRETISPVPRRPLH